MIRNRNYLSPGSKANARHVYTTSNLHVKFWIEAPPKVQVATPANHPEGRHDIATSVDERPNYVVLLLGRVPTL